MTTYNTLVNAIAQEAARLHGLTAKQLREVAKLRGIENADKAAPSTVLMSILVKGFELERDVEIVTE